MQEIIKNTYMTFAEVLYTTVKKEIKLVSGDREMVLQIINFCAIGC